MDSQLLLVAWPDAVWREAIIIQQGDPMSIMEPQVNVSGLTLFAAGAQALPSSGWMTVPGALSQVSAGSLSQVWGVNSYGNVFQFQNGAWATIPGELSCISAAADGTVWGVNSYGSVFSYDGSTWLTMPGTLTQVSVGSATQIWGVNAPGNVFQFQNGDWVQIPGELSWVSAAADGTVWGVNSFGNVFSYDGSAWITMPGALKQVSVGSATRIFGVNAGGDVFQWTGTAWVTVPGALANVSVASDGTLWGVNSPGNVFHHVQAAPLVVFNPRLGELGLEPGDQAPFLFDVTNTAPGTQLQNVTLQLLYDRAAFASAGVTVAPDSVSVPGSLAYGQTVTLNAVMLTTSQSAQLGTYGFYGVSATYQVVVPPAPSAPVSTPTGGWMTFAVTPG